MSMQYTTETVVTPKRDWLYRFANYSKKTVTVELAVAAFMEDADAEALYLPDGFIPSGTPIARANAGTYNGLFVPWLPNSAATNGEETWICTLFDPVVLTRNLSGAIQEARVAASVLPGVAEHMVRLSKFPAYNDHTAFAGGAGSSAAVVAGDLLGGMIDVETDFGITGIAGI